MKTKKITVMIASAMLLATLLISCHRTTCPTYGKAADELRQEVRI